MLTIAQGKFSLTLEICALTLTNMNMMALRKALETVEAQEGRKTVGHHGELTKFNIPRTVWRRHTDMNPARADELPLYGESVAMKELIRIRTQLEAPLFDSAFWIGVYWKGGAKAIRKSKESGEYQYGHVPNKYRKFGDALLREYIIYSADKRFAQRSQPRHGKNGRIVFNNG